MTLHMRVARSARAVPTLGIIADLFERLHASGIVYCHWKSNEHLDASLAGDTDLDVLVDRSAAHALARLLDDAGFKRFMALTGRGYAGIDDWIGMDAASGRLVHAHVHYQLTVGEQFLKGFRLPWEAMVLGTRQWDEHRGLYVADPHVELVLHVVRATLKIRRRDLLYAPFGRSYAGAGTLREFRWLARQFTPQRLMEVAAALVGPAAMPTILGLARAQDLPLRGLLELRARAEPPLSAYRLFSAPEAWARRWWIELQARAERLGRRLIRRPWARPRMPPGGGLSIALVGGDGAGKSTLARALSDWLSRQAVVLSFYGGSGTGPGSLGRRFLERLRALIPLKRPAHAGRRRNDAAPVARGLLRGVWRAVWALALARERQQRARAAYRARSRGAIVIWDRFAQTQVPGVNDGLQLAHWRNARSPLARWAARREHDLLSATEIYAPDLVIKLHVSYPVALARKPDTPPRRLREKLDVTRRLRYPNGTRVVDVDADQPLEQVLRDVQRAIWEAL
jgi:thymidylate kinase